VLAAAEPNMPALSARTGRRDLRGYRHVTASECAVLTLIFAAIAVRLGNFGAAIGIGLSGPTAKARIRLGAVFGAIEGGMPLVGLLLGRGTAQPARSAK
jgi:hypothetical protein